MEGIKLTCIEYENLKLEKKKTRDKLFDLKFEMFMNKNNDGKLNLLKEKEQILKKELAKISCKIAMYEAENNIEKKKEGKKK